MGFFKKIGAGIKKASKQISFKNLVKVGGMVDPTGIVSGMQSAHYDNKEAKNLERYAQQAREQENQMLADQYQAQSAYQSKLANDKATQAGASAMQYVAGTKLGTSFLNGAVSGAGGAVIDSSIGGFFKLHKTKILIGGGVAFVGVLLLVFKNKIFGSGKKKSRY